MSKTDKNNDDLLKQYTDNLKSGSYGKTYADIYKDAEEKNIVYLDINSLHPAPDGWNFFPQISEPKLLEMIFSILENGLFNPIIVWEQEDGCMILSGHNRVEAYKRIIKKYRDTPNFKKEEYETIPAIVFKKGEIDEEKAREIIIDTNYIQRDEDKRLMPKIIKNRLDIVKNRKDIKGNTIDIVAEELGLSRTKIYEDQLIANKIIPELNDFFFNNIIKKKSLLRFAWFTKEVQEWIYNNFRDDITDNNVMKLKRHMDKDSMEECFKNNEIKMVNVYVKIPEEFRDEFRKMASEWIEEKTKNEFKEMIPEQMEEKNEA